MEQQHSSMQSLWESSSPLPAKTYPCTVQAEASNGHTTCIIVNMCALLLVLLVMVGIVRYLLLKAEKKNEVRSERIIGSVNELLRTVNELKHSHEILSRKRQDAYEEMKEAVCSTIDSRAKDLIKEMSELKPKPTLPDKTSYDAAVDAWIYISNHLSALGRDRFKIPHVYAFLAGHDVEAAELKADLDTISETRREEVNTIIGDIKLFNSQHLATIESWLSAQLGDVKTLRDAVRCPLGQPFDNELDEHLLGDTITDGEPVAKVASLGYLFPGSLNGCYRVKSKVLVESD